MGNSSDAFGRKGSSAVGKLADDNNRRLGNGDWNSWSSSSTSANNYKYKGDGGGSFTLPPEAFQKTVKAAWKKPSFWSGKSVVEKNALAAFFQMRFYAMQSDAHLNDLRNAQWYKNNDWNDKPASAMVHLFEQFDKSKIVLKKTDSEYWKAKGLSEQQSQLMASTDSFDAAKADPQHYIKMSISENRAYILANAYRQQHNMPPVHKKVTPPAPATTHQPLGNDKLTKPLAQTASSSAKTNVTTNTHTTPHVTNNVAAKTASGAPQSMQDPHPHAQLLHQNAQRQNYGFAPMPFYALDDAAGYMQHFQPRQTVLSPTYGAFATRQRQTYRNRTWGGTIWDHDDVRNSVYRPNLGRARIGRTGNRKIGHEKGGGTVAKNLSPATPQTRGSRWGYRPYFETASNLVHNVYDMQRHAAYSDGAYGGMRWDRSVASASNRNGLVKRVGQMGMLANQYQSMSNYA